MLPDLYPYVRKLTSSELVLFDFQYIDYDRWREHFFARLCDDCPDMVIEDDTGCWDCPARGDCDDPACRHYMEYISALRYLVQAEFFLNKTLGEWGGC